MGGSFSWSLLPVVEAAAEAKKEEEEEVVVVVVVVAAESAGRLLCGSSLSGVIREFQECLFGREVAGRMGVFKAGCGCAEARRMVMEDAGRVGTNASDVECGWRIGGVYTEDPQGRRFCVAGVVMVSVRC